MFIQDLKKLTQKLWLIITCILLVGVGHFFVLNIYTHYLLKKSVQSLDERLNQACLFKGLLLLSPSKGVLDLYTNYSMFRKPSERFRVAIIYKSGLGDKFSALKFQQAATNLGWDSVVIGDLIYFRSFTESLLTMGQLSLALHRFKPDIVFCLHDCYKPNYYDHYLLISEPDFIEESVNGLTMNTKMYPNTQHYQGLVLGFNEEQNQFIADSLKIKHKNHKIDWIAGYHVSPQHDYQALSTIKNVFFCGDLFDPLRTSIPYKELYSTLDNHARLEAYGYGPLIESYKGFKGFAPFDHNKFMDKIHDCGCALVLHSARHLKSNIPSARIFEATGARALAICDKLGFIERHYGDTVLYLDQSEATMSLSEQMLKHLSWIEEHPEEAKMKAEKAYLVTKEQFSAEGLLLQLREMHEYRKEYKTQ